MPDPRRPQRSKNERLAAGSLLLAETHSRREVRDAVDRHIALAAAEAEQRHQANERRAAILALLLLSAKAMADDVRKALLSARERSRIAARRRLAVEFRAVGIVLAAHQWVIGARTDVDDAHAASAAESLASQWRMFAIAQVVAGGHKDVAPGVAIQSTSRAMVARLDRTVVTEGAQAYNDEHRAAAADIVAFDKKFRDGALADRIDRALVRKWVAMLDACRFCWPYDGDTTPIGQSFEDGAEPGFMHPRCRCIDVLVPRNE